MVCNELEPGSYLQPQRHTVRVTNFLFDILFYHLACLCNNFMASPIICMLVVGPWP